MKCPLESRESYPCLLLYHQSTHRVVSISHIDLKNTFCVIIRMRCCKQTSRVSDYFSPSSNTHTILKWRKLGFQLWFNHICNASLDKPNKRIRYLDWSDFTI